MGRNLFASLRQLYRKDGGHNYGKSLLSRCVGEGDALLNIALQTLDTRIKQLLLLVGNPGQGVDSFLNAVWLKFGSVKSLDRGNAVGLTPSSTGTEKKSQPVFSAIAAPPGTPGR